MSLKQEWNEQDRCGVRTSTQVEVFLGRETLRRAKQIASFKGIALGGYIAFLVRTGVNHDHEDMKQHS